MISFCRIPWLYGLDQLILPARQLEHLEQLGDAALDGVALLTVQARRPRIRARELS